jgi:hypothetical protein
MSAYWDLHDGSANTGTKISDGKLQTCVIGHNDWLTPLLRQSGVPPETQSPATCEGRASGQRFYSGRNRMS